MRSIVFLSLCALPVEIFGQAVLKTEPPVEAGELGEKKFTITPGTRIPLSLINSVSTKHAA
ncbi:MAG TPA: hypothetical protein VEX68_20195, partial [Bryobacteraceae bacterium]|nr:hypothetical protein [Bryobacteraceae bacterium]